MNRLDSSCLSNQANDLRSPPAQRYPRAVELFCQGKPLEEVFHIDSGLVKLTRVTQDGRQLIIQLVFAAAWIGTDAVLSECDAPVSAVTCSDVLVRRVPASVFRRRLHEDPSFSFDIHRLHALEWCRHMDWIVHLGCSNSRQRLLRVLRGFVSALGLANTRSDIKFHLPLHHWEVASLIAVTPEHLSRLLNLVQTEGLLRRDKGWIIISDPQRFYDVCDSSTVDNTPGVTMHV